MVKRFKKVTLFTVLMVGEGETEKAFLDHLKELYVERGCGTKTTVRNAHGKSPDHIVNFAFRQNRNKEYDRTVIFLDTDVPWSKKAIEEARRKKYIMVGSEPCIEGLFLLMLDHAVPDNTRDCKRNIKLIDLITNKDLTCKETYKDLFPLELLEEKRKQIPQLNDLINNIKE